MDEVQDIEYDLAEFLESHPPNQKVKIIELAKHEAERHGGFNKFITPQLELHCGSNSCNGPRFFRVNGQLPIKLRDNGPNNFYVMYRCHNCLEQTKIYSLHVEIDKDDSTKGTIYKYGEIPNFGPPTPSRLIKLIGPDRDDFLKGRRCENQGLGVGAFIYYRRVVENQKNRILSEIVKVCEKIGTSTEQIEVLKNSITETQFSKALNNARNAIPESLLINGHNPLVLLHSALSEGVHALSDDQCLELASSVRIVLGELSERLSQALKDEKELTSALGVLMRPKKS